MVYKVHFSEAYTTSAVGDPISSLQGVAQEVDSEVLRFGDVVLYKYRFPRFPAWQRLFITAEWIKKAKGKSFKSE